MQSQEEFYYFYGFVLIFGRAILDSISIRVIFL